MKHRVIFIYLFYFLFIFNIRLLRKKIRKKNKHRVNVQGAQFSVFGLSEYCGQEFIEAIYFHGNTVLVLLQFGAIVVYS